MINFHLTPLALRVADSEKYYPDTDISESEENYIFNFEIPGAMRDDIKIWIENDLLTVSGEKKEDAANHSERLVSERAFGKFERSFRLPGAVDRNKVSAEMVNGVLTIKLPKVVVAKEISIN